jgi:phage gpG-like protein
MKISLKGTASAELAKAKKKIAERYQEARIKKMSAALAQESHKLIKEGFATGTDPYGRRWPKAKDRPSGRPMHRTGALSRSYKVAHSLTYTPLRYAWYLQKGTKTTRPRYQVPVRTLPVRWRTAYQRVIKKYMTGLL